MHRGIARRDAIDEEILSLLEANARLRYEDLALKVGLSANACRNRVGALIKSGVIRGFHADVDRDAVGPPVHAIVELRTRTGAGLPDLERFLLDIDGVRLVEHLAGPVHYSVRVRVNDVPALDALIQTIQANAAVESTNTRLVTRRMGTVDGLA